MEVKNIVQSLLDFLRMIKEVFSLIYSVLTEGGVDFQLYLREEREDLAKARCLLAKLLRKELSKKYILVLGVFCVSITSLCLAWYCTDDYLVSLYIEFFASGFLFLFLVIAAGSNLQHKMIVRLLFVGVLVLGFGLMLHLDIFNDRGELFHNSGFFQSIAIELGAGIILFVVLENFIQRRIAIHKARANELIHELEIKNKKIAEIDEELNEPFTFSILIPEYLDPLHELLESTEEGIVLAGGLQPKDYEWEKAWEKYLREKDKKAKNNNKN